MKQNIHQHPHSLKMRAFSLLLVAPLALASTTIKRQSASASATNDGITAISDAVQLLTDAINAYQGGILETASVFNASLNVHRVNRAAKATADASPSFTEAQSQAIVQNVNDSVGVTIPISVDAIEAKKPYVFPEPEILPSPPFPLFVCFPSIFLERSFKAAEDC